MNLPFDGGVNVTETGQLPAGGIAPVHPFESRPKPVPLILTIGADNSTLLLLVKVTVCGLLCVPAANLPKSTFFGDNPARSLLLARGGLGCALVRPSCAHKTAHIAIATPVARRDQITRRDITSTTCVRTVTLCHRKNRSNCTHFCRPQLPLPSQFRRPLASGVSGAHCVWGRIST